MVTTARDVMTADVECIGAAESLLDAARKMRDREIGALPVCGDDGRLTGIITDRDIVIRCVAAGDDPARTTAGSIAEGAPVTVGPDDPIDEVAETMGSYQVKRLPVVDDHRLVGIVSESDLARHLQPGEIGDTIQAVKD